MDAAPWFVKSIGRAAGVSLRRYLAIYSMIEALIVMLMPLSFMPIMTAFRAYGHGRSFWRWFGVGCALPYVSLFVVMFVVHRDEKRPALAGV